jgi:hypothetical protein
MKTHRSRHVDFDATTCFFHSCRKLFTELVVILELISPGRYQGEEVGSATAATAAGSACAGPQDVVLGEHAQEYAGSCSTGAAALEAEAQAARVAKAAAEVSM